MKNRMKTVLSRLQNPTVIVACVSGILAILVNTGLISVPEADHVKDLTNGILTIGITAGIFGNPDSHIQ
jgi:uncharacterized membrane protein